MLIDEDEASKIVRMLSSGYYRSKRKVLTKYFRRSRSSLARFNMFTNTLQLGIMNALFKVQQTMRQGKRLLDTGASDEKELQRLESTLFANHHLARVLKTIVDGIAWRNLSYKRPILRLLSENKSSGYLTDHEIRTYKKQLSIRRHRILINDLTRYLRIADFIQIEKTGHVMFFESKDLGKKIKDTSQIFDQLKKDKRAPTPQELRQIVAQMSFVDNKISIPVVKGGRISEIEYEIIDDVCPIPTHHKTVQQMIKTAGRKGYSMGALEPGYFISVVSYDKFKNKREVDQGFKNYKSEFKKQKEKCFLGNHGPLFSISSWDAFHEEGGHFMRNYTPFSVLPFRDKDCINLMMGFLQITVWFDIEVLLQRLRDEGWMVKFNKNLKKQKRVNPSEYEAFSSYIDENDKENLINVEINDGDKVFGITIPLTEILIMISTYYKIDFIIGSIKSRFSDNKERAKLPKSRAVAVNYSNEEHILK